MRYAPGSRFARHSPPRGEEFFVLKGTFQEETGDFPTGTYVRNPPGTGHAPGSETGCTIFVKLWQFRVDDCERIVCLPGEGAAAALRPGRVIVANPVQGHGRVRDDRRLASRRGLARELASDKLLLDARVTAAALVSGGIALMIARADGAREGCLAERVVAALPPRLIEATVTFHARTGRGNRTALARDSHLDGAAKKLKMRTRSTGRLSY